MNSRLLPNRMPFGSWPVLVTRVEEAKHGCDLLYLGGEWGRFTSEAQKGHTLRNASREISYSSPYSTFSHTSTLPSAVAVILLPSKASGCVPKGHCQINLSTFLLPLRRLQRSPLPNGPFEAVNHVHVPQRLGQGSYEGNVRAQNQFINQLLGVAA
jgi:hypothetical protein